MVRRVRFPSASITATTFIAVIAYLNLIEAELGEIASSCNDATKTERFVNMIHSADSKDTLSAIGTKIKENTLSKQEKGLIRKVYRKK